MAVPGDLPGVAHPSRALPPVATSPREVVDLLVQCSVLVLQIRNGRRNLPSGAAELFANLLPQRRLPVQEVLEFKLASLLSKRLHLWVGLLIPIVAADACQHGRGNQPPADATNPASTRRHGHALPPGRNALPPLASASLGSQGNLRRETLAHPGALHQSIAQTVVQAIRPALPELERLRNESVTAPVRGPRHRAVAVAGLDFAQAGLEDLAIGDDLALPRGPRPELAAARAAGVVLIRLRLADALHLSFDAHLSLQFRPVNHERCIRVRRQLGPLAAVVVGEERAAALVEALQQHDAR